MVLATVGSLKTLEAPPPGISSGSSGVTGLFEGADIDLELDNYSIFGTFPRQALEVKPLIRDGVDSGNEGPEAKLLQGFESIEQLGYGAHALASLYQFEHLSSGGGK